ncbi:MAG: hypothetical protein J6M18_05835 [Actinomycetaceae bacterium]|nr:hypothetical protein [Actinomycetaceae bacterium]
MFYVQGVSDEGFTRVHSVLENADAPERYVYEFPESSYIIEDEETNILYVMRADITGDEVVSVIDAPWVVDANGVAIPTHYELRFMR